MTCVLTTWHGLEAPLCETIAAEEQPVCLYAAEESKATVLGGLLCPVVGVEEDRRQRQTVEKESTMLPAAVKPSASANVGLYRVLARRS